MDKDENIKALNLCADFIDDISKCIDKKDELQKGDRDAWGSWFDELMLWSNISERMSTKLREIALEVKSLS